MKYKIGEFSKLTDVPVKTLRYYDEIDLFKPAETDFYSNYRYYKEEQNHWDHWEEKDFLIQKEKVYEEQENLNKKIKKLDELRTRISNGMIYKESVTNVLTKRKEK